MIRRYAIAEDNKPVTTSFTVIIVSGQTRYFLETGTRVYWSLITESNVTQGGVDTLSGPFPHTPTAGEASSGLYSIRSISGVSATAEYISGSLMVYYNGQLLSKDDQFSENANGYNFTFSGDSLDPDFPDATEDVSVAFRDSNLVVLGGSEAISIPSDGYYPDAATGFYVTLSGFSTGVTVNLTTTYG
jgi:hypothetical protein